MKKTYQKPETNVVLMKVNMLLMVSGEVTGDVGMRWNESATDGEYGL